MAYDKTDYLKEYYRVNKERLKKYAAEYRSTRKDIYSQHSKNWRKKKRKNGLCVYCGKPPIHSNITFCEICWFKDKSRKHLGSVKRWKELKDLFDKQNGCCALTGEKLVLGENSSLDHIKPKLRFPEFKNDINNLEWVSRKINSIKRDNTKEEFIAICRKVVQISDMNKQ